ncbi:protein of unknown function [Butyrivibrio proteoclasticus]|uniref:Mobile element protein CD1107-like domain-containing protein n=1 Tax=Butyrivibrio proteoclasticus TaxID=43305 RepID=A0A1I5WTC4_9FIRM|nr:DUF4366 domain-containing protein [Butyrivibrio proteoclasticus]SFQ22970.1 protein of unknown function [Butyrivibrio proteoclasticus]
MKQKIKALLLRTAIITATIFGMAGPSITAYAHVDPADIEAEETEPEPPAYDETEKMGPLTPDGNLTIVDDYGDPDKSGKQFITVTTKNGNIFYIIIDRDDEGESTVHFLNLVDERDILSLLDEDEIKELKGETDEEEMPAPVVEEPKEEPEPEPEPEKKGGSKVALIVIILLLAGAGGFYIYSNRDEFIHKEKEDPDKDFQEDEEKNVLDNVPEENENPEE